MSVQPPPEPGWWLASDGRWYPPQPGSAAVAPGKAWYKRLWFLILAGVFGVLVALAIIGAINGPQKKTVATRPAAATATSRAPAPPTTSKPVVTTNPPVVTTKQPPASTTPPTAPIATSIVGDSGHVSDADLAAFDVCKQFVTDQLKAPLGAVWRNPRGNQVRYLGPGVDNMITVSASVDSQNSFGAKVRSTYDCSVTPTGGKNWRLQDLQILP